MTAPPPVSILVPTYQGARWILETIGSALAQTFCDFELLVVDDASSDGTPDLAASCRDPRVRVLANARRLGLVGNWNRSIAAARAPLVKFLFQDDLLRPPCLERMVEAFRERPAAGLVFARRAILVERDGSDDGGSWEGLATARSACGDTPRWSPPRALFDPWIRAKALGNSIGEPTSVLLSRAALSAVGLFNPRMVQSPDMEMWARISFHFDVGFLDEELTVFRAHARSATRRNLLGARHWLDRLWLLEGLLDDPAIAAGTPVLARLRRQELRRVLRRLTLRRPEDRGLTPRRTLPGLRDYAARRLLRALRLAEPLHPRLEASGA